MLSGQGQGDPCRNEDSNVAMRECYTREQEIVNSEADSLAKKLAAELRKEAQDFRTTSWVVSDLVLKAGLQITRSQATWREYRDQYCKAVMYRLTTGTGAGTAYEDCLYKLGKARLQELQDFSPKNPRPHRNE